MEALIILGAVVVITIMYFVAVEFRRIAAMKGHDEAKYFWWTFLLGVVGMLMVVALPQGDRTTDEVKTEELPEI